MRFALLFTLFFAAFLTACSESFTDPRDGQVYKVVQIGNVTWFAQNLNYEVDGSVCPEGDNRNCEKYGRLYTWEAAQNACPEGWLLPDSLDFAKLVVQVGGESQAGDALKATNGWFKTAPTRLVSRRSLPAIAAPFMKARAALTTVSAVMPIFGVLRKR